MIFKHLQYLKCNAFPQLMLVQGSRVRGKASGAIGYAAMDAGSTGAK